MKSVESLQPDDSEVPISAESLREFHAARLLLLLRFAGENQRQVDSLTKLAKLDFFVRYPQFLKTITKAPNTPLLAVESPMIRFHYGPWDKRYYDLLAYLKSRGLVNVERKGRGLSITLTQEGTDVTARLSRRSSFADLIAVMKEVKRQFGHWSGTRLKNFIYDKFQDEVAQLRRGEKIK
jgi:hypothetical protein